MIKIIERRHKKGDEYCKFCFHFFLNYQSELRLQTNLKLPSMNKKQKKQVLIEKEIFLNHFFPPIPMDGK